VRRLGPRFFGRDSVVVAPELLNKVLVVNGVRARITEVEAYTQDDPASHSHRGRTPRNAVMFGPPGRLYVYFIYGMHYCANIVTGPVGDGQAVLLRAVRIDGVDPRRTNGPAKLCQVLGIDLAMNNELAVVHDDGTAPPVEPLITARIGITKAAELRRRWLVE
jgi:DNA-3-methyladenine glycosylase